MSEEEIEKLKDVKQKFKTLHLILMNVERLHRGLFRFLSELDNENYISMSGKELSEYSDHASSIEVSLMGYMKEFISNIPIINTDSLKNDIISLIKDFKITSMDSLAEAIKDRTKVDDCIKLKHKYINDNFKRIDDEFEKYIPSENKNEENEKEIDDLLARACERFN